MEGHPYATLLAEGEERHRRERAEEAERRRAGGDSGEEEGGGRAKSPLRAQGPVFGTHQIVRMAVDNPGVFASMIKEVAADCKAWKDTAAGRGKTRWTPSRATGCAGNPCVYATQNTWR